MRESEQSAAGQGGAFRKKHKNAPAVAREGKSRTSSAESDNPLCPAIVAKAATVASFENIPHSKAIHAVREDIPIGRNTGKTAFPSAPMILPSIFCAG